VTRNYGDVNSRVLDGSYVETNEKTAFLRNGQKDSSWSADFVDVDDTRVQATRQYSPSLFRCLVKVYGLSLLKAHLCKFVCDLLLFVGPVLQK